MEARPVPVTAIILCYRQKDVIEAAIRAVVAQSHPIDELIISDDASDDGTFEVALRVVEEIRPDCSCIVRKNRKNLGLIEHHRVAIDLASNELIVGFAGDDISRPNRVTRLVDEYRAHGCPKYFLAHSKVEILDSKPVNIATPPVITYGYDLDGMAGAIALHYGATHAFTRALWYDFGPITERESYEDLILGFRAALVGQYHYIPEPLVEYRLGGISTGGNPLSRPQVTSRNLAVLRQRLADLDKAQALGLIADTAALRERLNRHIFRTATKDEQDRQNTYGGWLNYYYPPNAQRAWIDEEMARWTRAPLVHLGLQLLPGREALLSETLFSLRNLHYPHWRLSVVAFDPVTLPPALASLQASGHLEIKVLGDDDSLDVLNQRLGEGDADWVGQIWPGDRLSEDSLFTLVHRALGAKSPVVVYCDEDELTTGDRRRDHPLMKPDFNEDLLLAYNYVGQFFLTRRTAFVEVGGYQPQHEGAEEYGLLLALLGRFGAAACVHADELLYTRHQEGRQSHLSGSELGALSTDIVRAHLAVHCPGAEVIRDADKPLSRIRYPLTRTPKVSVVIAVDTVPDNWDATLVAVFERNSYPAFELIVVSREGDDETAGNFIDAASRRNARIVRCPRSAPRPAMINAGAAAAEGEYLLLLDAGIEAEDPAWLGNLVRHALRGGVGIVGAKILAPDHSILHAGVVLGIGNQPAAHPFVGQAAKDPGYMLRAITTQEVSAVTGACMLVGRALFRQVDGLDHGRFATTYYDVDLCLRVGKTGARVIFAEDAVVFSGTGKSAPLNPDAIAADAATLYARWGDLIGADRAYNKNLSISAEAFALETNPAARRSRSWQPRPRVLAFPIDHAGCGEYRIKAPARQLARSGIVDARWTEVILGPSDMLRADAESYVFQRHETENHHEFIRRCATHTRAFRVLEMDDFAHGFRDGRRDNRTGDYEPLARGFAKAASLCDRLVVSSQPLAEEYGHLASDILVVPNYIEDAKWGVLQPRRRQGRKPRVGWAGGSSHFGDLLLLEDVVKILAPEVEWVFLGICPESIRPWIHEHHDGVPIDGYPMKLASLDLDLALAPLEYCRFNECKTPLRLLEYGILGYPVVCTDIVTFAGDFPVDRVPNETDAWVEAIRTRIADRDELARSGDRMRQHIRAHWLLENNLDRWMAAWLPGASSETRT